MVVHFQSHLPELKQSVLTSPSFGLLEPVPRFGLIAPPVHTVKSGRQVEPDSQVQATNGVPVVDRFRRFYNPSRRLVVLANRPGNTIETDSGNYHFKQGAGGLSSAMIRALKKGDLWIASEVSNNGALPFDRVGSFANLLNGVASPPEFEIAGVPVTEQEYQAYYEDIANDTFWPLMHHREGFQNEFNFDPGSWETYKEVNRRFAEETLQRTNPNDMIWVHDYHFMLAPGIMRSILWKKGPLADRHIGYFHHIPFPQLPYFLEFPKQTQVDVIDGLLGSDLVGFHTDVYASNFLDAVQHLASEGELQNVRVNKRNRTVHYNGRQVKVGAFPISVDYNHIQQIVSDNEVLVNKIRNIDYAGVKHLVVSADRKDYTKGIPRRLDEIERFLDQDAGQPLPEYMGDIKFVFIAQPTREGIPAYDKEAALIQQKVTAINEKFRDPETSWTPIDIFGSKPFDETMAFLSAADAVLVTPLQDGMNLVAKEAAAAQRETDPNPGVLILSQYTGAAQELNSNLPGDHAIIVDPDKENSIANGLDQALKMEAPERRARMDRLQGYVRRSDVNHWRENYLTVFKKWIQQKKNHRLSRLMVANDKQFEPRQWTV